VLWYLLAAAVVVLALVVLGVALLGGWRDVRALTREIGRSGADVGTLTGELNAGLAELQARAPEPPPAPVGSAGAELAARVQRERAARR
jgi:hypothetical protein